MRISDWSSDVCSSDLIEDVAFAERGEVGGQRANLFGAMIDDQRIAALVPQRFDDVAAQRACDVGQGLRLRPIGGQLHAIAVVPAVTPDPQDAGLARAKAHLIAPLRSEAHTSELQSLLRISPAVF